MDGSSTRPAGVRACDSSRHESARDDASVSRPEIQEYPHDKEMMEALSKTGLSAVTIHVPDRVQVVLGRSSRPEQELRLQEVADDDVPVFRRRGGGCAVVLDPKNLVIHACIRTDKSLNPRRDFRLMSRWLVQGIDSAGLPGVRVEGTSDLVLGTRKVGGACMVRSRALLCYSTTLLFDPDVELMERYLLHPPREPAYRKGRSHRDFVKGLRDDFAGLSDIAELEARLRKALTKERLESLFARFRGPSEISPLLHFRDPVDPEAGDAALAVPELLQDFGHDFV